MPLLNDHKGNYSLGYGEEHMQQQVMEMLLKYPFYDLSGGYKKKIDPPKIYREVHVPEVGRRSDLIVKFSERKIFNIECKLFDADTVIKQAVDHLFWADYSYICFPHNVYLPNYRRKQMLEHGVGLLYFIPETGLIEVIMAEHNKKKDELIRNNIISTLKRIDLKNILDLKRVEIKNSQKLIEFE